jgi:demethylmenaquinone methyltransferase/2-methoxy-6-polyprenyl-1,4-benzoquinol methylase
MVAGDEDSYKYLVESIRKFPSQDNLLGLIEDTGFNQVKYMNLTMGVVAIHSGWKI